MRKETIKQTMKKSLAFLLAVVTLFTFLPLTVIAQEIDEFFEENISYNTADVVEEKIQRQKEPDIYSQDNIQDKDSLSERKKGIEEVEKIIEDKKQVDSLSSEEKQIICETFEIDSDEFDKLSEETDDVSSILLLSSIQRHTEITEEQIKKAAALESSGMLHASLEIFKLNNLKNNEVVDYEITKHEQFVEYILDAYKFDDIISAYIISELTEIDFASIKSPQGWIYTVSDIADYQFDDAEKEAVTLLANEYGFSIYVLADYVSKNSLTANDIYELTNQISVSADEMREISTQASPPSMSPPSTTEDQNGQKYISEPFKFNRNTNENINLNSGELTHETTDAVIPGVNGLDLVLTRRYESGKARLYNPSVRHNYTYADYYYVN